LLDGSVHIAEEDFAGNYLELRSGGAVPAFMDDRYDLHERRLVDDYLLLVRGQPGWNEALARRGVDVVVWRRESVLVELLSLDPAWGLAFDSSAASGSAATAQSDADPVTYVVYCRTSVTACFASNAPR
jgi:hypothetical protein